MSQAQSARVGSREIQSNSTNFGAGVNLMDAQIERVIAEILERDSESSESNLRELAQRVLYIAAQQCDKHFNECNARPNCHSLDACSVRGLASDGAQEKTK
jgi:hypothetical protein